MKGKGLNVLIVSESTSKRVFNSEANTKSIDKRLTVGEVGCCACCSQESVLNLLIPRQKCLKPFEEYLLIILSELLARFNQADSCSNRNNPCRPSYLAKQLFIITSELLGKLQSESQSWLLRQLSPILLCCKATL